MIQNYEEQYKTTVLDTGLIGSVGRWKGNRFGGVLLKVTQLFIFW